MAITHNLGFPRVGRNRELKFALEAYWKGKVSRQELTALGAQLRRSHWQDQAGLGLVPVGDFAFYDHVLDMSFALGNVPERVRALSGDALDSYFRVARGRSAGDSGAGVSAGEMTKWFDTNYHYIVPALSATTTFSLDPSRLLEQLAEARSLGVHAKPVIVGPITYLWLGKEKDGSAKLSLLPRLVSAYAELLTVLAREGVGWVQLDEPVLATELTQDWREALSTAYQSLSTANAGKLKLLVASYFGPLSDNLTLACGLPVQGLHIDAVHARHEVERVLALLPPDSVLSLGVIQGRNIWKTDLSGLLEWLEPLHDRLGQRLWLAPTCSLLHVPVDLTDEDGLDAEIRSWLAFAVQKLKELEVLASALNAGRDSVKAELADNRAAILARRTSTRVHDPAVKAAAETLEPSLGRRTSPYESRASQQAAVLRLPLLPTTTIGSFPQTPEIRATRSRYHGGLLGEDAYKVAMQAEIARSVRAQEELGLDVLVHGEPERNDMVEYFGEQLAGYALTHHGWVQSYGSRCVKPPVLFGDIRRPKPMTVEWFRYAQSLTRKPMKGMLTGPVTMLNWSFVRDDQPRATTCYQLALALRDEVLDLERAGARVIQIDEAALREGLPLRKSQWKEYLDWAVQAFRITANGVRDDTQIHTHMCYSEFNDIIASIADMDADVITIETSRSNMELLDAFKHFKYPNEIGPGVYDIHSPNLPRREHIVSLMRKAAERVPLRRLWVNPDCGLKTRAWDEVMPALQSMVAAARELREAQLA